MKQCNISSILDKTTLKGTNHSMYYSNIDKFDISDGIGIRIGLFVSGCSNKCPGCFQPETWDFHYGRPYTKETEDQIMYLLKPAAIDGLTLLGGDPFEAPNQQALLPLVRRVKTELRWKTIWAYTGYIYENLVEQKQYPCSDWTEEFLSYIDVLVDGPFIQEQRDLSLKFRGSKNQRIIDLNKTRAEGNIVLWGNHNE